MDPDPASIAFVFAALDLQQIIGVISVILLLVASALISGTEVAMFSLSPTDFEPDEQKRSTREQLVINLLNRPQKLLATILVTNNAVNIAIVLLFDSLSDAVFQNINVTFFGLNFQLIFEVVVVTFFILLFGEILPKVYASRNKVEFAHFMANPINLLDKLLTPLNVPMQMATVSVHKRLGQQTSGISVDQLSQALELTNYQHTTQQEQKILEGIVSFGNTDTKQVMKPRMDIFALNGDLTYQEIIPEIIKNGYSRIPVYEENIDSVLGILYVKDLLPHIDKENFDWKTLLREPYFVPENKKLDDLLNDFKDKKNHLAIVVDEYGGTSGLISLEDIIEEIVGDISDEFDDEDLIFSKLDDHNYVFEGKTPLKDFYRVLRLEDPVLFEDNRGEAETLAGFLLEISGSFPKKNDVIVFDKYSFTVEVIDNKRIKQIKLSIAGK